MLELRAGDVGLLVLAMTIGVGAAAGDDPPTREELGIGLVMRRVPGPRGPEDTLAVATTQLNHAEDGVLPVAEADATYLGIVTTQAVSEALARREPDLTPANLLVELPLLITSADPVSTGVRALHASGFPAVPVSPRKVMRSSAGSTIAVPCLLWSRGWPPACATTAQHAPCRQPEGAPMLITYCQPEGVP